MGLFNASSSVCNLYDLFGTFVIFLSFGKQITTPYLLAMTSSLVWTFLRLTE